jgi:undecaprenyl-diphosphatase
MMEFLFSVDKALFHFINQTLSNPVGDLLWPYITDYAQLLAVKLGFLLVWLLLMVRGGREGRTVALLLIPTIALSDQLSSSVIKEFVSRPRPCHSVGGVQIIQAVHLLVDCGPGKSFPSSHAVNNFAAATLFSLVYRKWAWAFLGWASLVALSRVAVGVHYPSDVLGGAVIGIAIGWCMLWIWRSVESWFFKGTRHAGPGRNGVT